MSTVKLPKVIDPAVMRPGFVEARSTISVGSLTRLRRIVVDGNTQIQAKISWGIDRNERSLVCGELNGLLKLQCQRCLGVFQKQIDKAFSLHVVYGNADDNLRDIGDEKLYLSAGETIVLSELIEDEIMLSLPMHIKHTEPDDCDQNMLDRATEYKPDSDSAKESPFAVLKNLKSLE